MKSFKKILALVLATVMVLGTMSMATFAAGDLTPDAKITINGLDEGDIVHLYQVFKWEDKNGWRILPAYADLVDSTKSNFRQNLKDIQDNKTGVSLDKADLEEIAKIAKTQTDLGDGSALTGTTYEYSTSTINDAGMYIALVTPGKAGVIYNPIVVSSDFSKTPNTSVIDASTATMGSAATAKKENIKVDKTSEEQDQATNETTNGNSDGTNNAHDVGDIVKFTVTTKIPAYSKSYTNPSFKVTDTLSNGLEMVVDTDHPFTVTSDVAGKASNTAPTTGDVSWTYEFDSAGIAALVDYADVTITYYAKITGAAATNVTEEENTVTVEFSNNPNDDGDKGTLKDKTKHYTFTLDGNLLGGKGYKNSELVKVGVDKDGRPIESVIKESSGYEAAALAGAEFGLYTTYEGADKELDAKLYKNDVFTTGKVTTDSQGLMFINGLDAGTYYLKELDAPNGYIRDTTVYEITITADIREEDVTEKIDGKDVTYKVPVLKSYTVTVNPGGTSTFSTTITGSEILESTTQGDTPTSIKNTKGVELPSTGGMGTTIFYIIGAVLVLGAGILLVTRRRMSAN